MNLYWSLGEPILVITLTYIRLLLRVGDKSCGRVADKFGLRAWTINLRTLLFGCTCLVFKTTCVDRGKPLREGAFFFTGRTLFPPLNKKNTRDKAKGLRVASERHIGELGVTRSSPRGARYSLWERTFFTRTVTRKARLRMGKSIGLLPRDTVL